jgi:hypothetical protein
MARLGKQRGYQGDGGQAGGEIGVYIESIVARLPTLRISGEKKVAKIPEI